MRLTSRGRVFEQVELPHANGALQEYLPRFLADVRVAVEATGIGCGCLSRSRVTSGPGVGASVEDQRHRECAHQDGYDRCRRASPAVAG